MERAPGMCAARYAPFSGGTNGPLSYLATDGQGTVSETLDGGGNGAVTFAQLYTPYGNTRYSSGSSPTTLGYTGQRADGATGLDYYHARYYDPVAGQFASADTVAAGLNRYGYVGSNPTTYTDPTGHCPWCIVGAIVGAVVGAAVVYGFQVASNVQNGGSLTDLSTWKPTDWGAIGKGALVGAVVGGTMGAAATVIAGAGTAGVTAAAAKTAGDVMFYSAVGAGEGLAQGVAAGDTGWDLVFDGAAGSASEIAGGFVGRGVGRLFNIDEATRGGRIATTVAGNIAGNLTSQTITTGRVDGYSFVTSVGLGVFFGGMRVKFGDERFLDGLAGGTDFLVQTGVTSLRNTSGPIISARPQPISRRTHPW